MGIVIFIRKRRRPGHQRTGRGFWVSREKEGRLGAPIFFQVFRIGEKNALAADSGLAVEKAVYGLEPQIGHGRVVAVGKRKGDGEFLVGPGIGAERTPPGFTRAFFRQEPLGFFNQFSRHRKKAFSKESAIRLASDSFDAHWYRHC